jgi:hypothetical protein
MIFPCQPVFSASITTRQAELQLKMAGVNDLLEQSLSYIKLRKKKA